MCSLDVYVTSIVDHKVTVSHKFFVLYYNRNLLINYESQWNAEDFYRWIDIINTKRYFLFESKCEEKKILIKLRSLRKNEDRE